ncbi:MAG: hypothetical protein IJX90_07065 [Blautia sp.]|nr:hypothetical protein [Blautia sp.]
MGQHTEIRIIFAPADKEQAADRRLHSIGDPDKCSRLQVNDMFFFLIPVWRIYSLPQVFLFLMKVIENGSLFGLVFQRDLFLFWQQFRKQAFHIIDEDFLIPCDKRY